MNIQELDAYNLADAVKFNDRLNPNLWDKNEQLKPEVKAQLLLIAEDFCESLGIEDLDIKDITLSGSNAAYTYTPNSDIDLHIVVDQPEDPVYRELFDAKKAQYNDTHDIKIKGADVELYVEAADKPPISQGTYSLLQDKWLQVPRRAKADVDDTTTRNKFETVGHAIERAIKSGSREKMDRVANKIRRMRQTGLEQHGEFGPENLAFKMLRTQGVLKQLHDARAEAKSQELSLKERRKPNSVFTYGFKHEESREPEIQMEDVPSIDTMPSDEEILKDFIKFCVAELKIDQLPKIKLRKDPQWSVVNRTFGRYINDEHLLEVAWGHRHIMDVLRTVAHELTHKHQHERDGERMGPDAGETGSPYENEANARAGILMRDYARLHPEYFAVGQAEELHGDEIAESASGYIPTKKQAKDPRFSMALTQDIKPGQLGKEANKLKLKTDSQGHPQVANPNGLFEELMLEFQLAKEGINAPVNKAKDSEQYYKFIMGKHKLGRPLTRQEQEFVRTYKMFGNQQVAEKKLFALAENEQLDEVRMAPSNLKQFANSPEAEGIQAGFEAELIFRDALNDDDGEDMEPDYDADERCRSIQQIIDFFNNGEYGGLSPRQERALQEGLDEQYFEWQDEQMYAEWQDERDELIRDHFLEEQPWTERLHAMLVDGMDKTDAEADDIIKFGEARKSGTLGKPGSEYTEEELDMLSDYNEAVGGAEEILDEEVENCISKQDGTYDSVLDDFRSDFYVNDDSGFFDDVGLRWMSDVANEYDLDWPYLTGASNGGSRDWEEIADSLNKAIDMPVKVSSGYHQATRKPGLWIVEPDSSLDPDDREDYGLEIVSPPMPLAQALEKLQQVTDWANSDEGNAYTNSSTGLHMGVSIPYKEGRVDYLKLILFLGDEYVLQQYGREANTYTKAAMKEIRQRAGTEKNATAVLELLKNNLLELAEREIAKSTGEGKYTSAHKHGKYIEFRSAGGDWLAEDNAEPGKLENTMMRYAYAMYLAGRPDLERREYAKKLYKLVAGGADDSTMALFSQYAAGELDKEQLKKRWAEKTLSKEAPSTIAKNNWVVINNNTGKTVPGQEYNGYTEDEVRERAKAKLSPASSDRDFDQAYSIHPKETGRWEVYRDDQGQEETLEIIDADRRGEAVDLAYDKYTGVIPFKVRAYYGDQEATPQKELSPRAKLAKRIVKTKDKPQPADNGQGKWEFYYAPTGRVLDSVDGASQSQAEMVLIDVRRRYNDLPAEQIRFRKVEPETQPDVAQNFSTNPNPTVQEPNQVRMPNGVPVWEVVDKSTGSIVNQLADHTMREAHSRMLAWLQSIGAEDPATYADRFGVRPKMLAAGEQNTAGAQTPATSGTRQIPNHLGPNGEEPNYELVMQRYPNAPLQRFYAANHPEAMDYLSRYRQTAAGAPHEYAIRNMPVTENFADGKGPGRPGDSQRHGIPKGATIAQLEKAAKAPGRKGQLARWQLNMRRGRKK